jgi:hypothetical protein
LTDKKGRTLNNGAALPSTLCCYEERPPNAKEPPDCLHIITVMLELSIEKRKNIEMQGKGDICYGRKSGIRKAIRNGEI